MTPIYAAADPVEAEILRAYLADHQIDSIILGAALWGAGGELPVNTYPQLALTDERDTERARELLRRYEHRRFSQATWQCPCGEANPITFDLCWACSAERPNLLA
ncbi:DUF2007 domain-containing protein [Sinimarinibacterium sp. NLF-5-8]|uniref:putative signal transducing protein n=1 Tax=Sinimarinibacterium sp. NLF-5-8 TaxID=2698684 RepID=UPI00137BC880|nr:DUF2007 domain-containing protein [Sinimarinibacterium sp. NLF-5-8]QHS10482.1 DUF2007 domain-containing protein [Sinimarinibacterium sp. NLF-5-8]